MESERDGLGCVRECNQAFAVVRVESCDEIRRSTSFIVVEIISCRSDFVEVVHEVLIFGPDGEESIEYQVVSESFGKVSSVSDVEKRDEIVE